jgi:hypothetical protein
MAWRLLGESPANEVREAIITAERFAEGLATEGAVRADRESAAVVLGRAEGSTYRPFTWAANYGWERITRSVAGADGVERKACYKLLRDLFCNPFRPLPPFDPNWLAWNGGTIRKLAVSIYDNRRFEDMPVLADALEEAGCDNSEILSHCRGGGPHARGCWLLDLLLGKS